MFLCTHFSNRRAAAWLTVFAGVCAAVVAFLAISPVESAPVDATFAVNDTSDAVDSNIGDGVCLAANGKCTLRAAIQEANARFAANPGTAYTITLPGGTIMSGPAVYPLTLTGSGEDNAATGDLDIKSNLLIQGLNIILVPLTISASGLGDRVFHVIQPPSGPISVTFANLQIANGSVTSDGGGGLLIANRGSVTLVGARVVNNTVLGSGAGFFDLLGGGISQTNGGTLTLNNVRMSSNKVLVPNNNSGSGGAISTFGKLIVNNSTIVSNVVTYDASAATVSGSGGGIGAFCCGSNSGLELNNSNVLSNAVVVRAAPGSQLFPGGSGGGITAGVPATITNSTIRGNLVLGGSNLNFVSSGGLLAFESLSMLNSTVAANQVTAASASTFSGAGGMSLIRSAQIVSSTIQGNSVTLAGEPAGSGGGIRASATITGFVVLLDRSAVFSNLASDGGGISASNSATTLAVRNSTIYFACVPTQIAPP